MTRPTPAAHSPDVSLVGRSQTVAELSRVLPQAGSGRACLLRGEPGVGKTAVLDSVVTHAERAGVRLLRVTGAESEVQLAFSGLHQLLLPLEPLRRHLADGHRDALDGALGATAGGVADPFVLCSATVDLLRRAAQQQPVLVVIDDVQWLDRSSTEVVAFLARRVRTLPVSVLLAARSGAACAIDQEHLDEFVLEPLSTAASMELLRTRFPDLAQHVRERVCAEAAGNVLALLELPAALTEPRATWALENRLPLTDRLQSVFAGRAEQLPQDVQWGLLLAALEPLYMRHAVGEPGLWKPAAEAGLLVSARDAVTFRHPLVRSALIEATPLSRVRQAHRHLAAFVADDADRSAWHRAGATVEPDESVAADLEAAGRRAWEKGGSAIAVAAWARAAELSEQPADRARRLTEAAYTAVQTGMVQYAEQLLAEARHAHADPAEAAGTARTAQAYLLLQCSGDLDGSLRLLHRALAESPTVISPDVNGFDETLNLLLYNCQYASRAAAWADFDAALAALPQAPSEVTQMSVDVVLRPAETAQQVRQRLLRIFAGLPEDEMPRTVVALCAPASVVGAMEPIRDRLFRLLKAERQEGVISTRLTLLLVLTHQEIQTANWPQADELAREGRDLAHGHGFQLLYWLFTCQLGKIAAHRGDSEQAVRLAVQADRWAAPRRIGLIRTVTTWIRGLAVLGDGRADDAFELMSRTSPVRPLPVRDRFVHQSLLDWIEAAVRCGRLDEARVHLAGARDIGLDRVSPYLALLVEGSAALCASEEEADARFRAALSMESADRYPFEQARLLLAYGQRLRRARRREEAAVRLQLAWEIFDRLGAQRWADTSAGELRAAGRAVSAVRRPEPGGGLTAQEILIAQLAARGLTNKQIGTQLDLSPRTVSTHLYNVFPKLGVTSRAALGDALRSAGLGGGTAL
ncbi:helix-turn-helix transcriptional regulator [Streptomyces maremycinicus]|uniref:helix-turn-helix transcriptional regulator n=1 Tax=Streptomyces maremycinicus TaxID=1679753 RepID=UPI0007C77736|nr:AAA family ATPase [Streptomyces sp. NBRC 110468]